MPRPIRHVAATLPFLLLVVACGGSETTGPPPAEIIGVQVTPANAQLEFIGATVQLAARVFRDDGSTVADAVLVWNSSDPSVATVDAGGRVTAVSTGSADITASFQSLSASARIVVTTPNCVNAVGLQPGEWESLALGCAVDLPAGSAGDLYRLAVVNQASAEAANAVTTVSVATTSAVSTAPPASLRARPTRREPVLDRMERERLRIGARIALATARDHAERRTAEIELWERIRPTHDPTWLERRRQERPTAAAALLGSSPQRIMIRANAGTSTTCDVTPATPAFLVAENDYVAIYQDSVIGSDLSTQITTAHAQAMLDYYEAYGHDVIQDYFSGVPDIDGNGKIIGYVSFTTPATGGLVAGYVWGGDLFPQEDCATSNEAEVMYLNAGLIRALDEGFEQALDLVVHEAKHISSFWQGYRRSIRANSNQFQPLWIEEGTAEIGGNVAARTAWQDAGGPEPNVRVTPELFRDLAVGNDNEVIPEASNLIGRFVNVQRYLASQPNGVVVTPFGAGRGHSIYGSGWTFLRWLADAYGGAASAPLADAGFFRQMNDSLAAPGLGGLQAATGKSFPQLMEEYAAGLMLHATDVAPPQTAFDLYDFNVIESFCFAADNPPCDGSEPGPPGTFPWPVTAQSDGTMSVPFGTHSFKGSIGNGGVRIHEFESSGAGDLRVTVEAEEPSAIVVVRIR